MTATAATASPRAQARQLAAERRQRWQAYRDRVLKNHAYYAALARYGVALARFQEAVNGMFALVPDAFDSEPDDEFGYGRLHLDVILEDAEGVLWVLRHLQESWNSVSVLQHKMLAL